MTLSVTIFTRYSKIVLGQREYHLANRCMKRVITYTQYWIKER